jgi:hypothetical protein
MDIYYLYTQQLPVMRNHFKDYEVAKVFYRHSGTQFSGALLYSKSKNHLILVFPGTVGRNDWLRNLHFTNILVNLSLAKPLAFTQAS